MTALYEFLMYYVLKWVAFALVLLPPLLFLLMIYTEVIYKFPIGRIKELEKRAVYVEEWCKYHYKEETEEYKWIFDDEEWYVTKNKYYMKDQYFWSKCRDINYNIKQLKESIRRCTTKPMHFFSSFIEDVEERRLYAIDKAYKLDRFYNEFKNK